ncbi:MAG: class I SAM-dependent methyltransferase [Actinomycetota bacterium]|nr:class I SAM-dependent methyltransferase [Actinomycetota bacterium]
MSTVRPLPFAHTNAHDLGKWRFRAWIVARLAIPRSYRALYEGHLHMPGQMWFEDRRVLYEAVRALRPERCFEIGTWLGGGSTLVIARALRENGSGKLHTIEIMPDVHADAIRSYERHAPELRPFVEFHQGDYEAVFPELIKRAGGVDFFVVDGAEDGTQTMEQFEFFDAVSHPSTGLFAHDWESEKSRHVRPHLEQSDRWDVVRTAGPPKSVGLAVAVRRS